MFNKYICLYNIKVFIDGGCIIAPLCVQLLTLRAINISGCRPIVFSLVDKFTHVEVNSTSGDVIVRRNFIDGGPREHVFRFSLDGGATVGGRSN